MLLGPACDGGVGLGTIENLLVRNYRVDAPHLIFAMVEPQVQMVQSSGSVVESNGRIAFASFEQQHNFGIGTFNKDKDSSVNNVGIRTFVTVERLSQPPKLCPVPFAVDLVGGEGACQGFQLLTTPYRSLSHLWTIGNSLENDTRN